MILGIVVSLIALSVACLDTLAFWKTHRNAILLEFTGFIAVVLFSIYPGIFQSLAHSVGIGRAVDFVIYPILVWLFREAVLSRIRYHKQNQLITELARSVAIKEKIQVTKIQ